MQKTPLWKEKRLCFKQGQKMEALKEQLFK